MFSALISFLGGSVFRMVWGEVSAFVSKRQDHAQEIERMRLQGELDDKAHARSQDTIRLQAELGVKQIEVQRDAALMQSDADAFTTAMRDAFKPTGVYWVDLWNGVIRPQFAQIALLLWLAKVVGQGFVMDDYDRDMVGAVLGFFIADRSLGRRGK
jgi:hypothetical protein